MKLYKVISKDLEAKDGGKFSYKDYLPKNNKKGKWTPKIEDIEECEKGYHVTPYWNMYLTLTSSSDRVFEVEVKGIEEKKDIGVIDKYVCQSIRLVKEIKLKLDKNKNAGDRNTGNRNAGDRNTGNRNTGDRNTGNENTGNGNTGNRNTGDRNTGDLNTGNWNTGDWNSGHKNTGDWNTGDRNTGDLNTGNWNTGDLNTGNGNTGNGNTGNWNSGHKNTGDWNTGDRNTGNWNTGNWNTGDLNTGNWNSGHKNTGFFNSIKPKNILVFNKECSLLEWEKAIIPQFIYFNLIENDYKKSFIESFNKTTKGDVELLLKLPNFDYEVFEEISGINKQMIEEKLR